MKEVNFEPNLEGEQDISSSIVTKINSLLT